mmetsp:Transcript_25955/g.85454  ORF Transcript_25955/g.85454 Transcript_25955/m.85454 type:complete len:208 (+) Transcript_25955:3118-3741(+)
MVHANWASIVRRAADVGVVELDAQLLQEVAPNQRVRHILVLRPRPEEPSAVATASGSIVVGARAVVAVGPLSERQPLLTRVEAKKLHSVALLRQRSLHAIPHALESFLGININAHPLKGEQSFRKAQHVATVGLWIQRSRTTGGPALVPGLVLSCDLPEALVCLLLDRALTAQRHTSQKQHGVTGIRVPFAVIILHATMEEADAAQS